MRAASLLLIGSGGLIVIATIALLRTTGMQTAFACAGIAIECLGLGMLAQGYRSAVLHGDPS